MADGKQLILNIKSQADLSEMERAKKGLSDLSSGAEGLARMFQQLPDGIANAQVNLGNILKAAPLIRQAWDLGTQIGTALGGAIERVGERGFSLSSIIGEYDPRFDESIARAKERLDDLRAAIEAPPKSRGILEGLAEIGRQADETLAKLEHLNKLEKIREDDRRKTEDQDLRNRADDIRSDPRLTDEEREAARAAEKKRVLGIEFNRRQADRDSAVENLLEKENQASHKVSAAHAALEAQRERARRAADIQKEAQREWTEQGGVGTPADAGDEGKAFLAERLGELSAPDQEAAKIAGAQKELQKLQDAYAKTKTAREKLQEENAVRGGFDHRDTEIARNDIDSDLDAKRRARGAAEIVAEGDRAREQAAAEGQAAANPGAGDAEASQAAQEAGRAMQEGSATVANDMRELSQSAQQAFSRLSEVSTSFANATREMNTKIDQAVQIAREAEALARSGRQGLKSFNR